MRRYDSTQTTTRWDGKRVYLTTSYPVITPQDSDAIIITQEGMYLDQLAYKYYGDPTLYWIIALANGLGKGRLSVPLGIQIRVPSNVNDIIVQFNNLNS
jgi:phage tail protein X